MSLEPGSRIGPYDVVSPLGAGGDVTAARATPLTVVLNWRPAFR